MRDLGIPPSARQHYAQGRSQLIEEENAKSAVAHLRKAIREYPGYYEAYNLLGVAQLKLKQFKEAEAALRTAVAMSAEQFAPALVSLATLYSDQKRFAEAEPLAAQAVNLDHSVWYAHYELARARFALGRTEDALPSARVVAREQPGYARGRLLLALVLAQRREYEQALTHLDAYLRLVPDGAEYARALKLRAEVYRASTTVQAAAESSPSP